LAAADDIIDNDGALAGLAPQIERLHHRYLELSRRVRVFSNSGMSLKRGRRGVG
jgi:hypothetical protein